MTTLAAADARVLATLPKLYLPLWITTFDWLALWSECMNDREIFLFQRFSSTIAFSLTTMTRQVYAPKRLSRFCKQIQSGSTFFRLFPRFVVTYIPAFYISCNQNKSARVFFRESSFVVLFCFLRKFQQMAPHFTFFCLKNAAMELRNVKRS